MAQAPEENGFIRDIEEIRRRARQNIEDGAVTGDYRADRERVVELLNQALATEIVCTLRYKRHYFMARGIHSRPVAEEFLEHAHEEEAHADRITQLGGAPDYNPMGIGQRSHSEYVEGKSLVDMVREDLIAERIAIVSYSEMIQYVGDRDPTSRRLLEDILANEEEHADEMAEILTNLDVDRFQAARSELEESDEGVEGDVPDTHSAAPGTRPDAADGLSPHDLGYGASHGYRATHGGPTGPGDVPATSPNANDRS